MPSSTLDELRKLVHDLDPADKLTLIEELTHQLRPHLAAEIRAGRRSYLGVLAHLGPAPSMEDIEEARREAWANFPATST